MNRRWLPGLFASGAIVLVAFDTTLTLLVGVALLLATIAVGWRLIAEPGFLEADLDESAGAPTGADPGSDVEDPAPFSG